MIPSYFTPFYFGSGGDDSAGYAGPGDLISRYDVRILGDLADDTGARVSPTDLLQDPNVLVALADGAALINSAAQYGQRYTAAELAALTGVDQNLLLRLNADLAFVYLCQRRGIKPPMYDETYKRSEANLERLRNGDMMFNVSADVNAGTPTDQFQSMATYQTVGLLRDRTNNHLFPVRRRQSPASGGNSGSAG